MSSTATISECGVYRYDLTRQWCSGPYALWIMLNPSTADADVDDPTIRRCIGFSKREGMGGLAVVNVCALRATDPKQLLAADDPVGPDNTATISDWMERPGVGLVVAAWGAFPLANLLRRTFVERLAETSQRMLVCLGRTKTGAPRHPLYVKADTPLTTYHAAPLSSTQNPEGR